MNRETRAALAALNQAIDLEIEGQRFYLRAAERTSSPKGAEMFRSLADDEIVHERILRRQLEALSKGESWILPKGVAEVTSDLKAPLFPEDEEAFQRVVRPDASDLDALLFALQIENESFNLYHELARTTDDPDGKRMYKFLADAEREHFEQLMLNYEHLATVGSWPDTP